MLRCPIWMPAVLCLVANLCFAVAFPLKLDSAILTDGGRVIEAGDYQLSVDLGQQTFAISGGDQVTPAFFRARMRAAKAAVDASTLSLRPVEGEPRSLLVVRLPPADEWVASVHVLSEMVGVYTLISGKMNPKPGYPATSAYITFAPYGAVFLAPSWSREAMRSDEERKRFAGQRVRIRGALWKQAPKPAGEPIAQMTDACVYPIVSIALAPE